MTNNKAVLVYGAGISGCGAAEELQARGQQVFLYNDEPKEIATDLEAKLKANGGGIVFGHGEQLLASISTLVLSPGISIYNPLVQQAMAAGIRVISEVELAYSLYEGHIAAITGTNGKTTTTTLVGEMFATLPVKTAVGGNIGYALSKEIKGLTKDSWLAAELSSFQLEAVQSFKADIAVILNLTPDHIDRHRTLEEYGLRKQQVFGNQSRADYTVLNYDDPTVRSWGKNTKGTLCYFSRKPLEQGIYMDPEGNFVISWQGTKEIVCNRSDLKIFGGHNEENVLAAIACGYFAGVTLENMRQVLVAFRGVEHRLEYVATIDGVPYYNDSKATNPDSVIKALEAFPQGHIILLAGGHDKMTDIAPMMKLIKEKTDYLILLGEAKERFEAAAKAAGVQPIIMVDSFREAVLTAHRLAKSPQVVLLSPACSSYDMFDNFPQRGRAFKELVASLPGTKTQS